MNAILVGCGQIALTHLAALKRLGHTVTWVVGRHAERTEAFAKEHGIAHFTTDLCEALQSDADTAHICTPPTQHGEAIRQCLAAKKHVISEKPLCLTVSEAEALAALAEKSDVVTALCCNVRFYPANMEAAKAIREGKIGRPLILSGSYLQAFHAPPHDDGWRFDPALSGDQRAISEIGTHWVDLAYAWTGLRVTAVSAALGNWYPMRYRKDGKLTADPSGEPVRVETEDAAAITLRFENGAIGALMLSELSRGHFNDLSLEVAGTDGTLHWEELHPERLDRAEDGTMQAHALGTIAREDTFFYLFREVYAAIEGRAHHPFPTFADGAYLVRVCAAIRKSGVDGEWVNVSEC